MIAASTPWPMLKEQSGLLCAVTEVVLSRRLACTATGTADTSRLQSCPTGIPAGVRACLQYAVAATAAHSLAHCARLRLAAASSIDSVAAVGLGTHHLAQHTSASI